jgi:hypothetical protein
MPRQGVESTIPVFERANTVHALDRAATVKAFPLVVYIGLCMYMYVYVCMYVCMDKKRAK